MISNRYAKYNNPYLGEHYDENVPNSYITYLDCNNLYGFAIREPWPTGEFRFLDSDEIEDSELESKSTDDNMGFILGVDLGVSSKYP